MDRTLVEVIKSIRRYKETGKLPMDYDVTTKAPAPEDEGPNYIENTPRKEPFESYQAGVLADHMDGFIFSLTATQRKVYDLHMIGGLTLSEVSRILGIAPPSTFDHIQAIRAKASAIIAKHT